MCTVAFRLHTGAFSTSIIPLWWTRVGVSGLRGWRRNRVLTRPAVTAARNASLRNAGACANAAPGKTRRTCLRALFCNPLHPDNVFSRLRLACCCASNGVLVAMLDGYGSPPHILLQPSPHLALLYAAGVLTSAPRRLAGVETRRCHSLQAGSGSVWFSLGAASGLKKLARRKGMTDRYNAVAAKAHLCALRDAGVLSAGER